MDNGGGAGSGGHAGDPTRQANGGHPRERTRTASGGHPRERRRAPNGRRAADAGRAANGRRAADGSRAANGRRIRLLIADDHDLFRAGLASLLASEPDIEVVAQASGGGGAVRLAGELRPDVVLIDQRMPDLEGPQATRAILKRNPSTRVVALTVLPEDTAVAAAVEAGACGFLAKDTPIDGVVDAVRAAAQGAAWLSPQAATVVLGQLRREALEPEPAPAPERALSAREMEVLRLLAQGMENSEIADALHISHRTAKNHVSHILAKLGLPSRVQAATYAVRRGLA
jgi:DNA-binding NarL/FixJ family response regulator